MSRCSCTHFVTSACCIEHIACNLERRGPSCSSSGTAACLDEKLRLWCIFILYIFVYINYIAMVWTQILLYLLVSVSYKKRKKLVHNGGYYFFFFIENTLVIFVCLFFFLVIIFLWLIKELERSFWRNSEKQVCVCMRPAQLLARKGGGGKRGNLSQVLLLKHA